MMPPAAHVANAYMKKFTATTNTVDVGSIIAGLDTGRIENILDSEGKANFESAEDNLQDLATYAIMMLAYIKKGGNK
jgi:hypothetical protein